MTNKKFADNHVHNILGLFDSGTNFPSPKVKRDY